MSERSRTSMRTRTLRRCFLRSWRQRSSQIQWTGFLGPTEKKVNKDMGEPRPAENLVHECMGSCGAADHGSEEAGTEVQWERRQDYCK